MRRFVIFATLAATAAGGVLPPAPAPPPAPRLVRIAGARFVAASTGLPITLAGPNVVVKGPPWLPTVSATAPACADAVDDACAAAGTCASCTTFGAADVARFRARGWSALRLGVIWAGAQPRDEDALDAGFLARLHALLNVTDAAGLAVVLDFHADMTGSLNCGNGVPAWFQARAGGALVGAPLATAFPYSLVPGLDVAALPGFDACGANASAWAEFAGDAAYNLRSRCCAAMNSGNPGALGFTTLAQATIEYMITEGPGRAAFVRYWRLLAAAVRAHPSAVAAELMNEPMTLRRTRAFDTWREAGAAIAAEVPDMAVSVADTGEAVVLPAWAVDIIGGDELISNETLAWIRDPESHVFLAWHWYGTPASADDAVAEALALGDSWRVPTLLTEFMDCDAWRAADAAAIGHLYWHYSAYCTTGPAFANSSAAPFGACILGWAAGNSNYTCGA